MAELRDLFKRAIRVERDIWLLRYGKVMCWLWKKLAMASAYCHQEAWRVYGWLEKQDLVKDKAEKNDG